MTLRVLPMWTILRYLEPRQPLSTMHCGKLFYFWKSLDCLFTRFQKLNNHVSFWVCNYGKESFGLRTVGYTRSGWLSMKSLFVTVATGACSKFCWGTALGSGWSEGNVS
eukprot:11731615-Karenia_brevis.AAC.1